MSGDGRAPEPTEIVHLPGPSAAPVGVAAGLLFVVIGLYAGWFYAALGGAAAIVFAIAWVRSVAGDIDRLPR